MCRVAGLPALLEVGRQLLVALAEGPAGGGIEVIRAHDDEASPRIPVHGELRRIHAAASEAVGKGLLRVGQPLSRR